MFTKKRTGYLVLVVMLLCLGIVGAAQNKALSLRFSLDTQNEADKMYTVTVSGRVLDSITNQPIANANVRGHIVVWRAGGMKSDLFDRCPVQQTTSNPQGEYQLQFETPLTLSGPMKGKDALCIDAGAPGYETRPVYLKERVTPRQIQYENRDIKLAKGKTVQGTLVDTTGKPVSGAILSIQSGQNGDWSFFHSLGETKTDQNGKFQINCSTDEELTAADPWLQAFMPGYGVGFYFDILEKPDLGNLILSRGGEVKGKVLDASGKGIAHCDVAAFSPWMERWRVKTDADGNYTLTGLPGEKTILAFSERKNGKGIKDLAKVNLFAQLMPEKSLGDAPTCEIIPQEAQTLTAPDLIIGNTASISGKLIPARLSPPLKGLMVRLDSEWEKMVEVNGEGTFFFPSVPSGKHHLTVYLPNNLRYDRGIGRTDVNVEPRQTLEGVSISLEELAEARIQFLDPNGAPLEGITPGATWNRNGDGSWTEGARSDADGRAVLYLYPGDTQYLRGFDLDTKKQVSDGFVEITPKPNEVLDNIRLTMVHPSQIRFSVTDMQNQPARDVILLCTLAYANNTQYETKCKTDSEGHVELNQITPGTATLHIAPPQQEVSATTPLTEFTPGETKEMGTLILKPAETAK